MQSFNLPTRLVLFIEILKDSSGLCIFTIKSNKQIHIINNICYHQVKRTGKNSEQGHIMNR